MDVSDPKCFDPIVLEDKVISIFDHHIGFERYWEQKLGENAHIEFIGAAVTLIFEEWEKVGLVPQLSSETAKIMISGILDNTLNLSADITQQRDIDAKNILCKIAGVDDDWCNAYFSECQKTIEENLYTAITRDTKTIRETHNLPSTIGQLAVWDAQELLHKREIFL